VAGEIEGSRRELLAPPLFEIGDGLSGGFEDLPAPGRGKDQFRPTVRGIRLPFEVTEVLEFVDEFGAGRQAQLSLGRQVGQSDAFGPDVSPYLQVRESDVEEPAIGLGAIEEFGPELEEQTTEDLADGEPVVWESS